MTTGRRTTPPLLEVRGLSKSYGAQLALDDIDITVFPHEIVGLVGENGAGKSTLLKILAGVVHGYTGKIVYNGNPVALRQPHEATELGLSSCLSRTGARAQPARLREHVLVPMNRCSRASGS